ncbi:ABC transporter permease [Spiroplasma eriocheiris]|uniref:ABC-2 type transporter transmembrane domain-containing protein n=1 Tax=Spiroplasma eriocheiris TaxID=315358 RepID=A0A0H3XKA5_9MOLU|nr:ABC transporter permease [Spiroplasma eriocheiris]AHF57883.1 putative ABC-type multidrug transport system permease protein [Spiroplasma eriocheiris CCTCC M 207170]AKM54326.1 hypothetical protein SERIO_v1c07640 [Spiroplasma eriocheiris]
MVNKIKKSNAKQPGEFIFKQQPWGLYWKLMVLFLKSFRRNFRNIFFVFIMPIFFMVIFYFVLRDIYQNGTNMIKAGYILLAPMTAGITSLATTIAEWKNSIFLKRLDVTPVKKWQFISTLIIFYFIISILSTFWTMLWTIIVDPQPTVKYLATINWGYFILGVILFIFVSIGIGILIGGLAKSVGMAQALALSIYFPSMFLSGIMIPAYVIARARNIFNDIGYIFPHKYAATIAIYGWNINANPYIYDNPSDLTNKVSLIQAMGFSRLYIPIIVACGWSAGLFILSGLTFKWEVKN